MNKGNIFTVFVYTTIIVSLLSASNVFTKKQQSNINLFSPSQLLTPNFSLHNTYKIRHLVMRNWEMIKQSKLLKIISKIPTNLFNEKYGLKLGEFNNTTGTERVNY